MGYKELSMDVLQSGFNDLLSSEKCKNIESTILQLKNKKNLSKSERVEYLRARKIMMEHFSAKKFFESGAYVNWTAMTDYSDDFIMDKYRKVLS
jgi:hypothetical protein